MVGTKKHKIDDVTTEKAATESYLYTDKSNIYKEESSSPQRKVMNFLSYNNADILMPKVQNNAIPIDEKQPSVHGNDDLERNDDSLKSLNEASNIHDDNISIEYAAMDYDDDAEISHQKNMAHYLLPAAFIGLATIWTAFFIWSNIGIIQDGRALSQISALIIDWATPTILIAIGWLLFMRSSKAEAKRFGDVANHLSTQAQNVQDKMREVNEDIAMARDFLSQYSQDLEHIGRSATQNLTEASQALEIALDDSAMKAEKLEQVSTATNKNLDLLRKNLPVVSSAAKDATNMIGKAGIEAKEQMQSLKLAMDDSLVTIQLSKAELETLSLNNQKAVDDVQQSSNAIKSVTDDIITNSQTNILAIGNILKKEYRDFDTKVDETSALLHQKTSDLSESLEAKIVQLDNALQELHERNNVEDKNIDEMIRKIQNHIEESNKYLNVLSDNASENTAKMAFALNALKENSESVGEGLTSNHEQAELLIESSEKLLLALDSSSRELDETMPASMQRMDEIFTAIDARFANIFENVAKISDLEKGLSVHSEDIDKLIATTSEQIETLSIRQGDGFEANIQKANQLLQKLQASKDALRNINDIADQSFTDKIDKINNQIDESVKYSQTIIAKNIEFSANELANNSSSLIQKAAQKQITQIQENLEASLDTHIKGASQAVHNLQNQLSEIDQMTDIISKRVLETSQEFSSAGDESFSRQMALLTESLNSTAIDVAKIISNDVTDIAWAAYLKGDRGVFTRRAVKLLTANESKLIVSHYDENVEFRDHVNRYIHDFEAMMRVLLSTRDGNAIGVTMLSSDVGKLYVALAQAIERLRN